MQMSSKYCFQKAEDAFEYVKNGGYMVMIYHMRDEAMHKETKKLLKLINEYNDGENEKYLKPAAPYFGRGIQGCLGVAYAEIHVDTYTKEEWVATHPSNWNDPLLASYIL